MLNRRLRSRLAVCSTQRLRTPLRRASLSAALDFAKDGLAPNFVPECKLIEIASAPCAS
jgi:hypothetical protein